ncbi:MAG: hypothetical protein RIR26_955 [Pseudomonadota bacterium]
MSFKNIFLVAALILASCGRAPEVSDALTASAASQSVTQLKVHCRKYAEGARGMKLRDSITLAIDGKEVKLNRIQSSVSPDRTTTTTQTITGKINSVFDGNVVKSNHATVLLNPTTLTTQSELKKEDTKLRYALILYSEGKLSVLDAENKPLMLHSICRTVQ